MRISIEELITITGENTPKKQADWFEAYFDVKAIYDSNGVIITPAVFNALVAKQYGVFIQDNNESSSPQLISPKVKPNVNNVLNYDEILQLIKSTHPRPVHVNLRQAAEMLNVSEPIGLRGNYKIMEYDPSSSSVKETGSGELPKKLSMLWYLRACSHVVLHTTKFTDHVFPTLLALAVPIVYVGDF